MASEPAPRCRLSGVVRGAPWAQVLPSGEAIVGHLAASEVALPVRGVSRRHARVAWDGRALQVEDLGSKNGTFVNGRRVARASAAAGDELAFGPVTLRVEEVDAGDGALAIAAARLKRPPAADEVTEWLPAEPAPGDPALLRTVERWLDLLLGSGPPDLRRALAALGERTGARGALLLAWRGKGEPQALAAWGEGAGADRPELRRFLRGVLERGAGGPVCVPARLAGDPPLAVAAAVRPGRDLVGCVLREPGAADAEAQPLAAILARLVESARAGRRGAERRGGAAAGAAHAPPLPDGFVRGVSPAMQALYREIAQIRRGDFPVLFVGETGTGKEHLVRLHHDLSRRRSGPFVAINCAAIPAELLEAEMFGIERGVATGVAERQGKFLLAEGGTLFLDEIGDMPLPLQAKLLRALEERQVQPVGGSPAAVDVRVVAATNADLARRAADGAFRADLYYRIAGYVLRVPPLRERREDIPALVEHFLSSACREAGKWLPGVTVRALERLAAHAWPGNVRELAHEVRRLVYLCPEGQPIDSTMLSPAIAAAAPPAPEDGAAGTLELEPRLRELERRLVEEALARGGSRTRAAELLGISRNGLALKLERLGLAVPGRRETPRRARR
jgi:two-component system, NtrC family, response regulator